MSGISSKAANCLQNRYKYNGGNELQSNEFSDGSGLEMYDAVNRMYDAQLGRFWQIDELAESNWEWSPYFFANNNPVLFNDPFGLNPETSTPEKPKELKEIVIISTKKMDYWAKKRLMYDLQRRTGGNLNRIVSPSLREEMLRLERHSNFRQTVADMTREGDKVALEVGSWFVPVGALTKIRYLKYAERLFNFKRGRIFWSGGSEVAGATAKAYAKLFGGHTLEMTLKGKYLEILKNIKGYDAVKPLFDKASREFAEGAEGVVKVFQNATDGISVTSTWVREEYKVLSKATNVILEYINVFK